MSIIMFIDIMSIIVVFNISINRMFVIIIIMFYHDYDYRAQAGTSQ